MSDNLASLFPSAGASISSIHLNSHQMFAVGSTLIILPTVWLRNLSLLSYISGPPPKASTFICFWITGPWKFWELSLLCSWRSRGFNSGCALLVMGWNRGPDRFPPNRASNQPCKSALHNWHLWLLLLGSLCFPEHLFLHERAIEISSSCCGQVTCKLSSIPCTMHKWRTQTNLDYLMNKFRFISQSWMANSSWKFDFCEKPDLLLLLCSFIFCLVLYAGTAVCGFLIFGDSIKSQFTLSMPTKFMATKIAVWTTVSQQKRKRWTFLHESDRFWVAIPRFWVLNLHLQGGQPNDKVLIDDYACLLMPGGALAFSQA